MTRRILFRPVLQMLLLCLLSVACLPQASKPIVVIESPPHGSQYHEGDVVAVQSTSTDSTGVMQVELVVDEITVDTVTVPGDQGQPAFTCIQTWKATAGPHVVSVHAHNAAGVAGAPAIISISVIPAAATGAAPTVGANPSQTPTTAALAPTPSAPSSATPSRTPPSPGPAVCANNAAFVADVTIPDGTVVAAGQAISKVWRMRNTGSCVWGPDYQFVVVGGEAMSPSPIIAVPNTAPGATADLLVQMTAPSAPGSHAGQWRMRSPGGVLFGATASVHIYVPGAPAPPQTTLSAPSGFTATGTGTTIAFTWQDNSTDESGFRIYQVGEVAPVVTIDAHAATGGMAFRWTNRPCNVSAAFFIRAFNPAGESPSSETSATETVPCAPGLAVESATPMGSLGLTLTDNSAIESGFRIYRSDSTTPVATYDAWPGVGISSLMSVGPFPCGSRASLYARAYNSAGESDSSGTSEGAMLKCQVGVTFTSVDVVSTALGKPGLAHIRLKFTANGQVQSWPSPTDYQPVNLGSSATMNVTYSFLLMRDTDLNVQIEGTEYDYNPSIQQSLQSDMGTVVKSYGGADDWGAGSQAEESTQVNGSYRIHYTIKVTR